MKDKIKEILDYWQFYINEPNNYKLLNIHFDEIKKVLDYITYLQEEIERQSKAQVILDDMLADYKSRFDKATEYIKEHTDKLKTTRVPKIDFNYNKVLEILKGSDKNEND